MERSGQAQPLGYSIGECWADGLNLPPGPGRDSADFLYRNVIGWVRFMAKFKEYHEVPENYQHYTLNKLARARELNLRILLCIDFHNIADSPQTYHQSRWVPQSVANSVRDILREVEPDWLEVANEPSYIQRPQPRLTPAEYARFVEQYMEGAQRANWRGLIAADQTTERKFPGDQSQRWESLDWAQGFAEVRHSWVLDRRSEDPGIFRHQILETFPRRNNPHLGTRWPIWENEFSSTGRQVHCNSDLAYDMTRAACSAFRSVNVPFGWLTMGGDRPDWGTPGGSGWGMSTALTNSHGDYSMVAKALADDQRVRLPEKRGVKGTAPAYNLIRRAMELPNVRAAHSDRKFQKYLRNFKKAVRAPVSADPPDEG